jgi:hypothetical protein
MNVLTSQDVALIGCCPCQPDACEAPRKECQSISVAACGFSLPALSTIPAEDRCKMFRKKKESFHRVSSYSNTTDGETSTDDEEFTITAIYQNDYVTIGEGEDAVRTCTSRQFSTAYLFTDTQTFSSDDPEVEGSTAVYTFSSSSGIGAPCSGSFTMTQTGFPDDSGVLNICPLPGLDVPIDVYTYSTLGIFTFSETFPSFETTITDTLTITYSEPVTIASLTAEIEVRKTMISGEDWPGSDCSSQVEFSYGYEDPPEIPDPAPDPPDPVPELAVVCEQVSAVTKARYRVGIPAGARWDATTAEWLAWDAAGEEDEERGEEPPKTTLDAAHAAWEIAHAAWTAADPDERGEEPLEPTKRTTYELQWDEVFFPAEWEAWKALSDAFDAATAAHAIWEDADPDDRGDEPVIPDDPGAEPSPAPSLVTSRSWVYGGTAEWSGWFEIPIPEGQGETRVVNLLVICYRSAALGQKPTAHGEVYEL